MHPDKIPPDIAKLHATFELLTKTKLTLDWTRLDAWRVFIGFRVPPFSIHDLRIVIDYLRLNRKPAVLIGSLKFHNLIGRVDYFEEDLSIAIQISRPTPPQFFEHTTPGTTTKRVMAIPDAGAERFRSAGEVIEAMRKAADGAVDTIRVV